LALWADLTDLRDWVIVCEAAFTVFQRGPYLLEQQITILGSFYSKKPFRSMIFCYENIKN